MCACVKLFMRKNFLRDGLLFLIRKCKELWWCGKGQIAKEEENSKLIFCNTNLSYSVLLLHRFSLPVLRRGQREQRPLIKLIEDGSINTTHVCSFYPSGGLDRANH